MGMFARSGCKVACFQNRPEVGLGRRGGSEGACRVTLGVATGVLTRWLGDCGSQFSKGLGGGVRKKARLNGLRIHELRHSFASIALGRGESMRTVAGLLGHSEVQTTLGYAHLVEAPVKEATERVSSYIASQIKPHRPNSQYRQNNSQASRTHTSGDQGFSAVRQDHQNVLRETRLGPRYVPPRHQGVAPERAEVMSLRND